VQLFGAAGLQFDMLLHVAWLPLLSTGQVVLSPAVHVCVHTLKPDCA